MDGAQRTGVHGEDSHEQTVARLWEELSSSLLRWFTAQTGDEHAAEDLLQESFLRVHRRLSEVRDQESLASWIRSIARNQLVDWRRRSAPPVQSVTDEEPASTSEPVEDVGAVVATWLAPAIDELSESDREVLRLTELEGLSQRDAADRLGLTLTAVKSRVLRGRARLRKDILDCCALEFDRRGGIVDYVKRVSDCCDT